MDSVAIILGRREYLLMLFVYVACPNVRSKSKCQTKRYAFASP